MCQYYCNSLQHQRAVLNVANLLIRYTKTFCCFADILSMNVFSTYMIEEQLIIRPFPLNCQLHQASFLQNKLIIRKKPSNPLLCCIS